MTDAPFRDPLQALAPKAIREFTDREEPQQVFRSAFERVLSCPEGKIVLTYYGVGGIGKTSLITAIQRFMKDESFNAVWGCLRLEEKENRDAADGLKNLAVALYSDHEVPFPTFHLGYSILFALANPHLSLGTMFQSRSVIAQMGRKSGSLADFVETIQESLPEIFSVIEEIAPPVKAFHLFTRGYKYVMDRFEQKKYEPALQALKVLVNDLEGEKERNAREEIRKLLPVLFSFDLNQWVAEQKGRKIPVLFIDTYDAFDLDKSSGSIDLCPDGWVEEVAIALRQGLVVICGREKIRWADSGWDTPNGAMEQHRIGNLSDKDVRGFLSSCGVMGEGTQEAICLACQGHPYYLDLCVSTYEDIVRGGRIPVAADIASRKEEVLDRFLRYHKDDRYTATLKVLSVPNQFDLDLLMSLVREFQTGYSVPEFESTLGRYSFMQKNSDGTWRMHLLMREGFATRWDTDSALLQKVEEFIFRYYSNLLEGLGAKEITPLHRTWFREAFHHGARSKGVEDFTGWYWKTESPFAEAMEFQVVVPLREALLSLQEQRLGRGHSLVAATLRELGNSSREMCRFDEARGFYSRSICIAVGNPAGSLTGLVNAYLDFGDLCKFLNSHDEAERNYLLAKEAWKREGGGAESPVYALILSNLASLEKERGHPEEALRLMQNALEIRRRVFPEGNETVGSSMVNIAGILQILNRYSESIVLAMDAVKYITDLQKTENHRQVASALSNLGGLLMDLGEYREAEKAYDKALLIRESIFPTGHAIVERSRINLAWLYKRLGRFDKSWALFNEVLVARKKIYGTIDHTSIAGILSGLGKLYVDMGRFREAEDSYLKALKIQEKILPSMHHMICRSKRDLAWLYLDMNRYEESLRLFQELVDFFLRLYYEKDHIDVANALSDLGKWFAVTGNYLEAEKRYTQAKKIRELLFPKSLYPQGHEMIIRSKYDLASLYQQMNRYEKSCGLFRELVEELKKVYGTEKHLEVADALSGLGGLLVEMYDYTEAETCYRQAMAIRKLISPPGHGLISRSMLDLAWLHKRMNQYEKAGVLFKEVVYLWKSAYGSEMHPDIAHAHECIGYMFKDMGAYVDAEQQFLKSMAIRQNLLSEGHRWIIDSKRALAWLYKDMTRYRESLVLFEEVVELEKRMFGTDNHPAVAEALASLGGLLLAVGSYEKAEKRYLQAMKIRESLFPKGHEMNARSMYDLGVLYLETGRFKESRVLLNEVEDLLRNAHGTEEHPYVAVALSKYGDLCVALGDYPEAEKRYSKALVIREKWFPKNHQDIGRSKNCLAQLWKRMRRYEDSRAMYETLVEDLKENYGTEMHPAVAMALSSLGSLLVEMGDYEAAEKRYGEAKRIREALFPCGHEMIGLSIGDFAGLYQVTGKHEEAQAAFLELVEFWKRIYETENHPAVAGALAGLAGVLKAMGNHQEAETRMLAVKKIRERLFPCRVQ